jgi:hypothetical protein
MSKFAAIWRESAPSRHTPTFSQGPAYCVKASFSKSQIRSRCLREGFLAGLGHRGKASGAAGYQGSR